jgi:hypothetical protein
MLLKLNCGSIEDIALKEPVLIAEFGFFTFLTMIVTVPLSKEEELTVSTLTLKEQLSWVAPIQAEVLLERMH